jgi:hypothetical protein
MEQEAEGVAAQKAAPGLGEAKVIAAKAEAKKVDAVAIRDVGGAEAQVVKDKELAVASGTEAKWLAEAKGIEEKAKAMKQLHDAGKEHEEFRLKLEKDRDVELAAIDVQRKIAEAHSGLVSEGLKQAKIDIVGGENDFFEKIVRSVGSGKSVDRLVENSSTLADIKNTFFNGDPEFFKSQLRKWVADFGIKTADVKNLTVAALLAKLMASTKDSSLQSLLKSAQAMAKESGLADVMAAAVLEEKPVANA